MSTVAPELFISVLKEILSKSSDDDLAKELGVGKSTLASWRRRGAVPEKTLDRIIAQFELEPDDIILASSGRSDLVQRQISVAINVALFNYVRSLPDADIIEAAAWAATSYQEIRDLVLSKFRNDGIAYAKIEEFTKLVMLISRGEHATPEQFALLRAKAPDGSVAVSHQFLSTDPEP